LGGFWVDIVGVAGGFFAFIDADSLLGFTREFMDFFGA